MRVLVSDPLSEVGLRIFQQSPDIQVDVKTGLNPGELKDIIGEYDALVIRSATRVNAELLDCATRLKVIGRAGIGLDNVDVAAASQRGIVVMNTPEGNTITTAEHTIAMLLALTRNIPQATASLKQGRWEKKRLKGREIFNKTMGVIGAGHIGRIVADRAKGLKMKVIVHDPYLPPETIQRLDLEAVSFDELLERADYITLHTPRTKETLDMINRGTLARMKPGAMLINCSRGGIVNEDDLYDALQSGQLAGAALDVFATEPPEEHKLMSLSNFICTPHLGASTQEAQDNVAKDVAEQIVAYLLEGTVKNAVNVPSISAELMGVLRPYVALIERMGALQAQLTDTAVTDVEVHYAGKVTRYDLSPLSTALLKGLLTPMLKDEVNFVNAPLIAADRGIKVVESKSATSEDFASLIRVTVKSLEDRNTVSGTIFGRNLPRILRINNFYLEAAPEGHILLILNRNVPGALGRIGSVLGAHAINIGRIQAAEAREEDQNVIFLATSRSVDDRVLQEIQALEEVISARRIEL